MRFPVDRPFTITNEFKPGHNGIDIAPPAGKTGVPCYAPENGRIIRSAYLAYPEGNFVTMLGDSNARYYFGHFAERRVVTGQRVSEGQVIGTLGMTGAATGIHTHHEVEAVNGQGPVNPRGFYGDLINGTKPKKEEEMSTRATRDQIVQLYGAYTGVAATDEEVRVWEGKPLEELVAALYGTPKTAEYYTDVQATRARVTQLEKELAEAQKQGDTVTKLEELRTLIEAIKAKVEQE